MNHRVCAALLVFVLACLVLPVVEAGGSNDRDRFSLRDVDGPTAFAFDGFATVGTVVAPAAAVGRFTADGMDTSGMASVPSLWAARYSRRPSRARTP